MIVWNDFLNDARVLKEAESLQKAGYAVTVHALLVPGVTPALEYLDSGVAVRRVARNPLQPMAKPRIISGDIVVRGKFAGLQKLWKIATRAMTHVVLLIKMIRGRPDLIHAHDANTLPTAWLAAKLSGAKLVYDAHEISTSREGYAGFRNLVAVVEKCLMPRADGTITTTDSRAKFFARAYHIPRPLVLQNRPRLQSSERSSRIREELGLQQPWPIVLYQGGIQQGRGLERLIRAASSIPDAYFVLIGGGRLERVLHEIVREQGLEDRVFLVPTVPLADLPSYTASADIGVQPIENTCLNHSTTDSNKLFEYVQAGLPVIASAFPEIRKIVNAYDLGLLVEPGNTGDLISAITALVNHSEKRMYLSSRAQDAARILNWEGQEKLLLNLYDRILR